MKKGPVRDSNPGPLRPKRRIIPLDQTAATSSVRAPFGFYFSHKVAKDNNAKPKAGIEPTTSRLLSECSTAKLLRRCVDLRFIRECF